MPTNGILVCLMLLTPQLFGRLGLCYLMTYNSFLIYILFFTCLFLVKAGLHLNLDFKLLLQIWGAIPFFSLSNFVKCYFY